VLYGFARDSGARQLWDATLTGADARLICVTLVFHAVMCGCAARSERRPLLVAIGAVAM
jgi:hypothetical protein